MGFPHKKPLANNMKPEHNIKNNRHEKYQKSALIGWLLSMIGLPISWFLWEAPGKLLIIIGFAFGFYGIVGGILTLLTTKDN